jgi:hypothetical protein
MTVLVDSRPHCIDIATHLARRAAMAKKRKAKAKKTKTKRRKKK